MENETLVGNVAKVAIEPHAVHIWEVALDRSVAETKNLRELLDREERTRADAFHFERDRNHFIVARGFLRVLLSRYLGTQPADLAFRYSSHGKPYLCPDRDGYQFNVSHSHGVAVVAIAQGPEVGIDVELIRPGPADESIAENYFSAAEVEKLRSLPIHLRNQGFFNCWTRKEAYIKARGDGLSLPLDHFEVTLAPGEPALLRHVVEETRDNRDWTLHSWEPAAGFAAAMVVEERGCMVRHFSL